jgi:transcription antitermination factor NusG
MKLARESSHWYVAMTLPQLETRALEKLTAAGFNAYLPRYRQDMFKPRTKTWVTVHKVLLTGYIFVDVSNGQFGTARDCDGVRGFVGACGVPERISGRFVEDFQLAETDGMFDKLQIRSTAKRDRLVNEFPPGSNVVISVGPWSQFAAVVKDVTNRAKVAVSFELFGREMDVEVEAEHLSAA